ncbi:MAG: prepilin peptidase leader peptidase (prepilin peptidase) / N-methyltransferase [Candidatus Taylorbacteria bacterium]|nr:prepilin peptidase leader peptidase (prepilin peptidase) / N-methyltransferase [Candidatus Taylorbacteria bacterium]
MISTIAIFVFIFGVIIGSFLNVVILRFKTGRTVGGRSFCFSCGKVLNALELIPVFSFLFQRGKCKSCKTPLSWQYPLVEIITGIVFVIVYFKTLAGFPFVSALSMVFYFAIFSILIVISVYDIRHKIVPDKLALWFASLSFVWLLATHNIFYFKTLGGLLNLLAGPILFLPFYALWRWSNGEWMGLGDGKLALGIGLLLGLAKGASAIILGFWIAAAVSLVMIGLQKIVKLNIPLLKMKSEMPFAPFLVLGTLLAYYYSPDLLSINVFLFGM